MTLQEAKDQAAQQHEFSNYAETYTTKRTNWSIGDIFDLAAELYARSKWNEACETQIKICYRAYMDQPVAQGANKFDAISNEMDAILTAPKPEFKP